MTELQETRKALSGTLPQPVTLAEAEYTLNCQVRLVLPLRRRQVAVEDAAAVLASGSADEKLSAVGLRVSEFTVVCARRISAGEPNNSSKHILHMIGSPS